MFVNQNANAYDRKTDTYIVAYIDFLGMTNRILPCSRKRMLEYHLKTNCLSGKILL